MAARCLCTYGSQGSVLNGFRKSTRPRRAVPREAGAAVAARSLGQARPHGSVHNWRAGPIRECNDRLTACPCSRACQQLIGSHHTSNFCSKCTIGRSIGPVQPSKADVAADPVDVPQDLGNMLGRGLDPAGRHAGNEVQKPEPKAADSKQNEAKSLATRAWLLPEHMSSGPRRPALINTKLAHQLENVESWKTSWSM